MSHYRAAPRLAHIACCAAGIGLTAAYANVDSLILLGKPSAVEAFTQNEARSVTVPMPCSCLMICRFGTVQQSASLFHASMVSLLQASSVSDPHQPGAQS